MAYLTDPFFTSSSFILHYFNEILNRFLTLYAQDFTKIVQDSTNVLIFANIGIIIGIGLIGALLERHFFGVIKKQIL